MKAIWEKTEQLEERERLPGHITTDVVVIGAGMVGLLTAYFLQKQGMDVVVVEAARIASGQTGRTTAKITSQHGLIYDKLVHRVSYKRAHGYAMANEEAIGAYEKIIAEEMIDCDFEYLPSYLYTLREEGFELLKKEAEAANMLDLPAVLVEGSRITELPFAVKGAVRFDRQAQIHPLKFIAGLAAGLTIYENTKVLEIRKHTVFTTEGDIRAKHIVFATHYPFVNVPGFYFLRQHQERSYVVALEGRAKLSGMYYSIDENGLSFRSGENRLLIGGGGHRTGKKVCERKLTETKEVGYGFLQKEVHTYYPGVEITDAWAAQDCMTHDGIPFIGSYSMLRPYWYVATGFHKWGMTSSMVAAQILSSEIAGKIHPYADVFAPQRFLFRAAIKNLLIDTGESICGLGKGLFSKQERRCPHMGCRLEWNAEEGTWDCPCHGSRFSAGGALVDNPAQIDLGEKE